MKIEHLSVRVLSSTAYIARSLRSYIYAFRRGLRQHLRLSPISFRRHDEPAMSGTHGYLRVEAFKHVTCAATRRRMLLPGLGGRLKFARWIWSRSQSEGERQEPSLTR